MAVPTNTLNTIAAVGNREDLSNELSLISPESTPFISNIGKATADATYTEWQTEELEAVDTDNSHLEGDDTANEAANIRDRVGNHTQIFKKSGGVAGTQQAVDKAAVADELDHQKMLKLKAMKRDMEVAMIGNNASRAQSGSTTRKLGGALAWLESNTSVGSTGADGGFASNVVSAATDGTARTFTETLFKDVLKQRFNTTGEAGDNLIAFMSANHKELFAAFAGLSETRDSVQGKKGKRVIYGAADVYVGNFGQITTIPHAYGLTRDVLIVDPSMFKVATLRKTFSEALAKSGDSDKFQIIGEVTLKCLNEKSHAAIRDLTA